MVVVHILSACDRANLLGDDNLHPQQAEQGGHNKNMEALTKGTDLGVRFNHACTCM